VIASQPLGRRRPWILLDITITAANISRGFKACQLSGKVETKNTLSSGRATKCCYIDIPTQ
jgi:hypothetical protein